jgi:hypothetical protein
VPRAPVQMDRCKMEHKRGNEAYIILHLGVLAVGVTSVAGERGRERARRRGFGLEAGRRGLPLPRLSYSACLCSSASCVHVFVRCTFVFLSHPRPPFVGPWTPPFIDTRRCLAVQWGCSLDLTWLAGKYPEPCTDNNVAVGGAP